MTARSRERRVPWLAVSTAIAVGCGAAQDGKASHGVTAAVESREVAVVWPSPARNGDPRETVVVLESPRTGGTALRLVHGFFEAVRRESIRDLGALLSEDATISSGPGSAAEPVPKVWAARFKRLDYGFSGAKHPYRSDELGLFTKEQLSGLLPPRHFELVPEEDELLAVVTTRDRRRISGPRHFGRRIEFVLGPTPLGFRIRRMFEDFRLP